mmetsp:Transcript_23058/g.55991  ORF Transcript_23058/g.55991 Transcript_23058/m.55991 type:complete len:377 (-) Transcript_23058:9-1139(-)
MARPVGKRFLAVLGAFTLLSASFFLGWWWCIGCWVTVVAIWHSGLWADRPRVAHTTVTHTKGRSGDRPFFTVDWVAGEMQGWRRTMEDAYLAMVNLPSGWTSRASASRSRPPGTSDAMLFAVFDGHGGSTVSGAARNWLPDRVARGLAENAGDTARALRNCFVELDKELRRVGKSQAQKQGVLSNPACNGRNAFDQMGCTAVVVLVLGRQIFCANVGDSRALLCRQGTTIELNKIHKPEDEAEKKRILAAGGRVKRHGPCFRVDGGLNLSRALGDFAYKDASLCAEQHKICAVPDVKELTLSRDDEFLVVACDGLFELLQPDQVIRFIRERLTRPDADVEAIVADLLREACTKDPHASGGKGTDNETVIIVRLHWT